MPDMVHELDIQGTPDQIQKALTEQNGIRGWWTNQATAQPKAGTVSEFPFMGGAVRLKFRVDDISPNHIAWSCVDGGPPDWAGTRVTWDWKPDENGGTKLVFAHRNFPSYDGSYGSTNYNWGYFLISLKDYIETGTGKPNAG